MKQYVRKNADGKKVLDFDLLDIAARVNFNTDALNFAGDLKIDLSDFAKSDCRAAIRNAVEAQAEFAFEIYDEEADLVSVSPDTRQMWIDTVANEFFAEVTKSFINICGRYGEVVRCDIGDYRDLNPDGEFYKNENGIFEVIDGKSEQIAEVRK